MWSTKVENQCETQWTTLFWKRIKSYQGDKYTHRSSDCNSKMLIHPRWRYSHGHLTVLLVAEKSKDLAYWEQRLISLKTKTLKKATTERARLERQHRCYHAWYKVSIPRTSREGERIDARETTMTRTARNMNATSSVSHVSHRHFEWHRQTNGR